MALATKRIFQVRGPLLLMPTAMCSSQMPLVTEGVFLPDGTFVPLPKLAVEPFLMLTSPDPTEHLIRYYGCYSNKPRGQRGLRTRASQREGRHTSPFADATEVRKGWAALIKRVCGADPLCCPKCGAEMKTIAFVERHQSDVIQKILRHCGLWEEAPARKPTEAIRILSGPPLGRIPAGFGPGLGLKFPLPLRHPPRLPESRFLSVSLCSDRKTGYALSMSAPLSGQPLGDPRWFATTHWSVVLAAREDDSVQGTQAMEKLCRTYWPPLYAYIRRDGHDPTEAQDLTQEFFARLLAREYLQNLHHQEGKFRSFLLAYVKNFLLEQRRRGRAQKRGGRCEFISLNQPVGEAGYLLEPVDELTPVEVFDRRWAQGILQTALDRLRQEYAARGQAALFDVLQDYQPREPGGRSYAQLGEDLGMTEAAVKGAVHRMRERHGELLREEIAQTVTRPEEINEELRHFRALLGRGSG